MAKWVSSSYLASYVTPSWFGDGTHLDQRWVSPDWLSTKYIVPGWLGDGTGIPPGKWIGSRWLRPGYVASNYLTNIGEIPTSLFTADSLSVSTTDAAVAPIRVLLGKTDVLSVGLSESFNTTYKRHVVAFDNVTLTFGEGVSSRLPRTVVETLGIAFTEVVSNNAGTAVTHSVSDTLNLLVDDPGINQGFQALDTLNVSISEARSYTVRLSRSDTLDVNFAEATSRTIEGAIIKQVTDSLQIAISDQQSRHVYRLLQLGDSLELQLNEFPTITLGIIPVYLQAFDNLSLSFAETAAISNTQEVVGKSVSDIFSLALGDGSSRVDLRFIVAGDTLLLQILDSLTVAKISIQQTWEAAQYPWGGSTLRDIKPLPVFAYGFDFYQVDSADTFVNNQSIVVMLERLGLTIYGRDRQGNWKEDPDVRKQIKGVYPIFRGEPGTIINIYVGAQEDPEGPVTWDGPHPFVLGDSTAVKPLISGHFMAIRFESNGQKPWKLLSYDLDITDVGRRN